MARKGALLDVTVDECCAAVLDATLTELVAEELAKGFPHSLIPYVCDFSISLVRHRTEQFAFATWSSRS
jgi:hypothetical protein